jgi:peptidoglycan-associated lipoprotein
MLASILFKILICTRFKMLRNLLIIIAILSLSSCKSKATKEDDTKISQQEEQQHRYEQEAYQTLTNEQQAEILDKQAQEAATAQAQAQAQEVEVQDRVFFGYDSTELSADAKQTLTTQAEWLKSDPTIKVIIEGHCDERGTREYNIALGEKRANAAKKFLISSGVQALRIKTVSYGKERPAFFGNNEESMSKNRRAVTVVN